MEGRNDQRLVVEVNSSPCVDAVFSIVLIIGLSDGPSLKARSLVKPSMAFMRLDSRQKLKTNLKRRVNDPPYFSRPLPNRSALGWEYPVIAPLIMRGRPILLLTAAVLTLLLLSGETDGSRRRRRRRSTTTRPPVDCQWSSWSLSYSNCGNTCGGTKTFTRYRCRPAEHGGADCVGDTQKTEPCAGSSCQNGGQWNGVSCTCSSGFYGSCCHRTLMCPPMDAPANGQISSPDTNGGVTVYFACDPGYTLLGSTSATCQSSGRWSDNRPICQIGTCPALPVLAHGSMYGSLSTGSTMTFSCQPGYTLSGPSSIRCNRHGAWSEQPPICTAAPPKPDRGYSKMTCPGILLQLFNAQCCHLLSMGPPVVFHSPMPGPGTHCSAIPMWYKARSILWNVERMLRTSTSQPSPSVVQLDALGALYVFGGLASTQTITDAGGQVTVYIRYGQHSYQGSWQHNIQSQP
ncbi:hypothetical protein Bbelb_368760 [Branchiostoma belcheri]|nr:hypothetical protein Bbelb_368760 [Branchiostoma belcheri]